jgi:hypothetical protein
VERLCEENGLRFSGRQLPSRHSLLEEQEMTYFSRKLRSGAEPGKLTKSPLSILKTPQPSASKQTNLRIKSEAPSQPKPAIKSCRVVIEPIDVGGSKSSETPVRANERKSVKFVSQAEEIKTEPVGSFAEAANENGCLNSVDADDVPESDNNEEDDDDYVQSSQAPSFSTKLWPLSKSTSRFVSFYEYSSPSIVLEDSSSPVHEISKEEARGERGEELSPPLFLEPSPEIQLSLTPAETTTTLVPFVKPPQRKQFRGYIKNQVPFWSNVEDYLDSGEGRKARIGTGDLCSVACYAPSTLEPFQGTIGALSSAKFEAMVERGILENSCADLAENSELMIALQPDGVSVLVPAVRAPRRGQFVVENVQKKVVENVEEVGDEQGPTTSTPFVRKTSKNSQTPTAASCAPSPVAGTPIPVETPQVRSFDPKCGLRE